MKLIVHVLAVISLAVFRTDCRERPNVREMSDDDHNRSDDLGVLDDRDLSNDGELSNVLDLPNSRDVSYGPDLPAGPNTESSTSFPYAHLYSTQINRELSNGEDLEILDDHNHSDDLGVLDDRDLSNDGELSNVLDLSNSHDVSYGPDLSAGPNNVSSTSFPYAHLYSNRVNVDIPAVEVVPGLVPDGFENFDFSVVYHQQKEESKGINAAQLRGKQQNKILKQIIKDLEYIKNNLTRATSDLKEDVQSIKENQINSTDIGKEIQVELQSIRDYQSNLTDIGKDLKDELQSVMGNINDSNSEFKKEVSSIISKLDSIKANQDCPNGLFQLASKWPKQCFKFFSNSQISWTAGKLKCQSEGLVLAKPYYPVELRRHLVQTYGNKRSWIGARGTGSTIKWDRDGTTLSSSHSAWWPGYPGSQTSSSYCVVYASDTNHMNSKPNNPYFINPCTTSNYPLCELLMG